METLSKNNHYFDIKNCNEFFKIYLIQRIKYRLIIKRNLFKFRRKKSSKKIKFISNQFNNNHINLHDISTNSIEQILNHQWIQIFKQRKSKYNLLNKIEIPLMNNAIDHHYDQQQSKSPLRHSPNGKHKRLLTKDIMSGINFKDLFFFLCTQKVSTL